MSSIIYNAFKHKVALQQLNWASDTIKVMLVGLAYSPNPDHGFVSEIAANELAGSGYTRKTLTGKSITKDNSSDLVRLDADNVSFSNINAGTFAGAVIYQQVGGDDSTPGDDVLILFIDTPNVQTNGTDVTIEFHQDGVIVF